MIEAGVPRWKPECVAICWRCASSVAVGLTTTPMNWPSHARPSGGHVQGLIRRLQPTTPSVSSAYVCTHSKGTPIASQKSASAPP